MFNFTNSTFAQSEDVLSQFDEELEESGSLPYCQLVADIGKQAAKADKNPLSYGICVNAENAETVSFVPDATWVEGADITIHPQSPATIDKGWVARTVNMVILHYSDLEVQEKRGEGDNSRWSFLGPQYQGRVKTTAGKLYEGHKDQSDSPYRIVRRLLVLFLDSELKPMHDSPLQLTVKGAFGASLSSEYQHFIDELSKAYCQASKASGGAVKGSKRFSRSAQSFAIFPVVFGPHIPKESDRSSYVCVTERYQPVFGDDKVGQTHEVEANGRKVKLHTADYRNFIVSKGSDLGQIISSMVVEFESFPLPNRGMEATAAPAADEPRTYQGEGTLDLSAMNFQPDGSLIVTLMTDQGPIPLHLPQSIADTVNTMATLTVSGTIPADGGPVQVSHCEADEDMAPAPVAAPTELSQGGLIPSY